MSMTSKMVPKHVNLTVRRWCAEESVPLQADAEDDALAPLDADLRRARASARA